MVGSLSSEITKNSHVSREAIFAESSNSYIPNIQKDAELCPFTN